MSYYQIVFENDFFVVVDKSSLVLSVPSRHAELDQRPVLGRLLEKDLGITIFPVHRLDYEVQGLIMFAKTPEAHKCGNRWFETKEVIKTYSALTKPHPQIKSNFWPNETYEWRCKLLRGKKRAYESPQGKDSVTLAVLKTVSDGIFHWEMSPITGRSHQLRYELFRHGHPILGDSLYSSEEKFHLPGIALRSFVIDFSKAHDAKKFSLPKKIFASAF